MVVNIYKIDYKKIKDNILSLSKSDYLVVKSNAYGFGFKKVVDIAYKLGMKKFCILDLKDAIYLRKKYPDVIILLLGPLCKEIIEEYILVKLFQSKKTKLLKF